MTTETKVYCPICSGRITDAHFEDGLVAEHEVWKVKGGEYALQYIELSHVACAERANEDRGARYWDIPGEGW